MTKTGRIVRWDAERGFGFVRVEGRSQDVFLHVRDFKGRGVPQIDMPVVFELFDNYLGKGPRASEVRPLDAAARTAPRSSAQRAERRAAAPVRIRPLAPGVLLLLAFAALVAWGLMHRRLAPVVPLAAVALNVLAFMTYWGDKYAATQRRWRTPESTLHALSLAGGWLGAWWAQTLLHHKVSKRDFQLVYWLTALLNIGAACAWLAR